MAHPNLPRLFSGTRSDDERDPEIADQQIKEVFSHYRRHLNVGMDMAFSDTSSGSRLNQSSRPPSMATSDTRDFNCDYQDPNPQILATSPLPPQPLTIPDFSQTNGVGDWSELSPGTNLNQTEIDIPMLGQTEGLENSPIDHSAQNTSADAEDTTDAAVWLFIKQNIEDFIYKRKSNAKLQRRVAEKLVTLADSLDDNDPYRCYHHKCSTKKFRDRSACLRHVRDFHLWQYEYDCSLIRRSNHHRVTKQNPKAKLHRRDKFGEYFRDIVGRRAEKSEIERCRLSLACPPRCPVCPRPFKEWSALHNHVLDEHCRRRSRKSSATSSRRGSETEPNLNADNELVSPVSDLSSTYSDRRGHLLIPPSTTQNSRTSHRGQGSLSAGTLSPARPSSICSDGGISPSQPPVDRRQTSVPDIHRLRDSQNSPGVPFPLPFSSQPPVLPQDPEYIPTTLCTMCDHPMLQCPTCQNLSRSLGGLWCHICFSVDRSSTGFDQSIPHLHLSTPTPTQDNAGLPLYQDTPSYAMTVPYNQSHGPRRENQRRQNNSGYNPYHGSGYRSFSATVGDGPQVMTTVQDPIRSMFPECKPSLYQIESLGPICAAPKSTLSKSMSLLHKSLTDLGKYLGDFKHLVIGDRSALCQAVPPQALESPVVVSERGSPRIAKARVDIGKGEKLDMRARLLPNERPGQLLRSRVQIVIKLIKLRSSAAEAAERRERQQSETSDQDTATAAEVSGADQQSAAVDKNEDADDEDSQNEEDENDDESPAGSVEEPGANDMDSLTTSFANRLSIWSQAYLEVDWANDQDVTEPNKEHEEASLGVYVATDLPSCLQNMPNWSKMLSELTGFRSDRAANRFFELLLQHLFLAILACDPSSESDGKKKLDEK